MSVRQDILFALRSLFVPTVVGGQANKSQLIAAAVRENYRLGIPRVDVFIIALKSLIG